MDSDPTNADPEITEDLIYGGHVRVRQPARGYRVNVDTILLAATLPPHRIGAGSVVELGCGVAAAVLIVAKNHNSITDKAFLGIERDPAFAGLARDNVALNGLQHKVRILECDALNPPADIGLFERVFFNPPFDQPGQGRAPAPGRRAARLEERPIEDWVKSWSNRMTAQASMTLIHRPERLNDILAALDGRLGGAEIYPIRPHAGAHARRVIVRAWKGSKAPLRLFKGLDLHPEGASEHKHTPEAEAILRGEAFIEFG